MLIEYSSDINVRRAVAQLMDDHKPNPYTGHVPTISDIVSVIVYAYGKRAAGSVRITVH